MFTPPVRTDGLVSPISQIARSDRWSVYHRLQELQIPCWCPTNSGLWVEINNAMDAILLRSVLWQLHGSRTELVDWLERCWDSQECE